MQTGNENHHSAPQTALICLCLVRCDIESFSDDYICKTSVECERSFTISKLALMKVSIAELKKLLNTSF